MQRIPKHVVKQSCEIKILFTLIVVDYAKNHFALFLRKIFKVMKFSVDTFRNISQIAPNFDIDFN